MTNEDQKKQWKKDAYQLKVDLDRRKKVIQRREVPIRVGKKTPLNSAPLPTNNTDLDAYYRNKLLH
ncbi:MAG: hypothetical protein ACO3K7_06410 [Candidatus Marinamargulisbacteria bacterium]